MNYRFTVNLLLNAEWKTIKAVAAVMELPFGRQISLSLSYWSHLGDIFKAYGNNLFVMYKNEIIPFDLDENDVKKGKAWIIKKQQKI